MSHNTWFHRIARMTVAAPLARTTMTPNQVTTARLFTGISAATCFAIGNDPWLAVGGGIFVVSMILDRADGDLARLTGQTSEKGHRYDLIADSLSNAMAFMGLGLGLSVTGGQFGLLALPMGLLAGIAVAAVLWVVMRIEEVEGQRAAEIGGIGGFDPDDAMLAVPVGVWLGWSEQLLLAAVIGAPLFAVLFFVVLRRRLAAQTP